MYVSVGVCIRTRTHTHCTWGTLGCEPRGQDETLGGPEESRWTTSRHKCIRTCVQSTNAYTHAWGRDEIVPGPLTTSLVQTLKTIGGIESLTTLGHFGQFDQIYGEVRSCKDLFWSTFDMLGPFASYSATLWGRDSIRKNEFLGVVVPLWGSARQRPVHCPTLYHPIWRPPCPSPILSYPIWKPPCPCPTCPTYFNVSQLVRWTTCPFPNFRDLDPLVLFPKFD